MDKIKLSGVFGWDITTHLINYILSEYDGAGVLNFHLTSEGGEVFSEFEISEILENFKKENPKVRMNLRLGTLVASAASALSARPFWDEVTATDKTVFMIHRPMTLLSFGDYEDFQSATNALSGLTRMYEELYTERTGKRLAEIKNLMRKDYWLFGEDILTEGFADSYDGGKEASAVSKAKKEEILAVARMKYRKAESDFRTLEFEKPSEQILETAAQFRGGIDEEKPPVAAAPEISKVDAKIKSDNIEEIEDKKGGQKMDLAELKEKHPELYNEIMKSGAENEKARVAALLEMGKESAYSGLAPVQAVITDSILNGKSKAETIPLITAALLKEKGVQEKAEKSEEVPPSNLGGTDNPDGLPEVQASHRKV